MENTVPWTYVITDLNGEEIVGTFCKKKLKKRSEKEFRVAKINKTKGEKV